MTLTVKHNNEKFGVGDRIRVYQKIKEKGKFRNQVFEGLVIKIKGEGDSKSFTVRRIGVNQIGIERIFPLNSPVIESIKVVKKGVEGIRRSKLYYVRNKSDRDIDKIYSRVSSKNQK